MKHTTHFLDGNELWNIYIYTYTQITEHIHIVCNIHDVHDIFSGYIQQICECCIPYGRLLHARIKSFHDFYICDANLNIQIELNYSRAELQQTPYGSDSMMSYINKVRIVIE